MKTHLGFKLLAIFLAGFSSIFTFGESQTNPIDASVMLALKRSLNQPEDLGWSDPEPCNWMHVVCSEDKRVTRIQIGHQNLQGTIPLNLSNLTELERLELQWNNISGPLPSLNGLSSLQVLMLSNNQFSSIPIDFFTGMSSLQSVEIDNNPFSAWQIPESLRNASTLQNFSANSANLSGKIPEFLGPDEFPGLINLHLAFNNLEGELPSSFSGSQIESLWVNGQKSDAKLSGRIDVIQNMTFLKEVWLHSNAFLGPLPDFSGLKGLESLSLRDNSFTGPVPMSLVNLGSLRVVNLTNNLLQGPMPKFSNLVAVDMTKDTNSLCLPEPGDCDPSVNLLLSIAKSMDYPTKFAENWKGNDPCADWFGITCNGVNITIVNFQKMGLTGMISPKFGSIKSLQRLVLADNNLTGTIPEELTTLPALTELDVSNNQLYGKVPAFKNNCHSFCMYKSKQKRFSRVQSPNAMVIHPRHSGSHNESVKITVAGSSVNVGAVSETRTIPSSENSDIQMVEAGNMVISIQVLKSVTNNFSEENILGQGRLWDGLQR
ncbi:hypothetical protein F0562_004110 [Nyssa sinensis]|uniref:Leucine-rich repeat-containing N-terminal plant-type domain-containing protein n=1 Tax=Nyssa sinensis TaxID=561372 RepID=A0A5J5C2F7_9ASTE|nr:hypothetical protein F0562_004110 [Nyssa sinensis]